MRAESFAGRLVAGGVTRSELRPVLNALFLPAQPWKTRLETTRRLAEELPTSWVGERSNRTRGQLLTVQSTFRDILRDHTLEEELRFLLGWIARLVHVRATEAKERERAHGRRREEGRDSRREPGGKRR